MPKKNNPGGTCGCCAICSRCRTDTDFHWRLWADDFDGYSSLGDLPPQYVPSSNGFGADVSVDGDHAVLEMFYPLQPTRTSDSYLRVDGLACNTFPFWAVATWKMSMRTGYDPSGFAYPYAVGQFFGTNAGIALHKTPTTPTPSPDAGEYWFDWRNGYPSTGIGGGDTVELRAAVFEDNNNLFWRELSIDGETSGDGYRLDECRNTFLGLQPSGPQITRNYFGECGLCELFFQWESTARSGGANGDILIDDVIIEASCGGDFYQTIGT